MSSREASNHLNWFTAAAVELGGVDAGCEFLHESGAVPLQPTASETYWFTVNLPEEGLVAAFYIVVRQTIPTCLAGVWMYRGLASDPLLIEHMNYRFSLPRPTFVGSRLPVAPIGLDIDVVEPMKRWTVAYHPADAGIAADIECEALMPPVLASSKEHFDQAIWCKGILRIGGRSYDVDAPGFRDRTWNAPRGEDSLAHPPLDYSWGVMERGRAAFCIRSADDPALGVEWSDRLSLPAERLFHGGWLYIDGSLYGVTRVSKRSERDFSCKGRPLSQKITFEDDQGGTHELTGQVVGAMYYHPWGNVGAWMSNTVWTLDSTLRGHGEIQELMWSGYAKACWR